MAHNVSCAREVILAAGNAHTTQILEMSGIGQPELLNNFDIPVILDLPGVGENYQGSVPRCAFHAQEDFTSHPVHAKIVTSTYSSFRSPLCWCRLLLSVTISPA